MEGGGVYSGSFTPNATAAKDVQAAASTYYLSQMPSTNVLPLLSTGAVDCPTWTSALATQASNGVLTPVSFTAGNLTDFVLANSAIFAAPCNSIIINASECVCSLAPPQYLILLTWARNRAMHRNGRAVCVYVRCLRLRACSTVAFISPFIAVASGLTSYFNTCNDPVGCPPPNFCPVGSFSVSPNTTS